MITTRVEQKKASRSGGLRPREYSPFSYQQKFSGIECLDAASTDIPEPIFDESKMSATGVLATTTRDREGDVIEVTGIQTARHQLNPIALLDHGLWYPFPIGKTMDDDGNYLVTIDANMGECLQTTYFYQNGPGAEVAEQVYHLYCQKILRANSIGYIDLLSKPFPANARTRGKTGKHILQCELLEATWCGLPCNPDAVMATLSRDKICGKVIAPAIKAMLTPYAQPKKIWANGASLTTIQSGSKLSNVKGTSMANKVARKGKTEGAGPQSSLDEATGGALRKGKAHPDGTVEEPADKPREQEVPVESKDAMEEVQESEEPLGAETLRDLHMDLLNVLNQYSGAFKKVENEKVKKGVNKLLDSLENCSADVAAMFEAAYPELEPLAAEVDAESDQDGTEEELVEDAVAEDDEIKSEDSEDDDEAGKSLKSKKGKAQKVVRSSEQEVKRLTKSQAGDIEGLKDLMEEMLSDPEMDAKTKAAVKYHLRSLGEMIEKQQGPAPEDSKEEDCSPEERKAILSLERAIARRERLLNRIGL